MRAAQAWRRTLLAAALILTCPPAFAVEATPRQTVSGVIVKTPHLPRPETSVYTDCLLCFAIRLDHPLGDDPSSPREILAVFLGMKNRVLLKPSRLMAGDRVRLTLTPFFRQPPSIRQLMRVGEDLAGVDAPMLWVDDWQSR